MLMSAEVMAQTSEVLKEHGLDTESRFLSGRQADPSSSTCQCYVVQWSLVVMAVCDICDLCYWIEVLT